MKKMLKKQYGDKKSKTVIFEHDKNFHNEKVHLMNKSRIKPMFEI